MTPRAEGRAWMRAAIDDLAQRTAQSTLITAGGLGRALAVHPMMALLFERVAFNAIGNVLHAHLMDDEYVAALAAAFRDEAEAGLDSEARIGYRRALMVTVGAWVAEHQPPGAEVER